MALLNKDVHITGKHSLMLEELKQQGIFEYYWQIYIVAPLIGLIYKRKALIDKSSTQDSTIFLTALTEKPERRDLIYFIYKSILLYDRDYESDTKERVNKAFRYINTEKAQQDEQLFNSYLLGGIEILHEKTIEKSKDLLKNIGNLIEELQPAEDLPDDKHGISNII